MIKSKKTKIQTNKRRNLVTNDKELLVMAHIKNYRCLFCKKIFISKLLKMSNVIVVLPHGLKS